MYDNVPVDALPAFRKLSARLSQNLLEQLNFWLAEHDRDENPQLAGTDRARAGLEIHQIEEVLVEEVLEAPETASTEKGSDRKTQ